MIKDVKMITPNDDKTKKLMVSRACLPKNLINICNICILRAVSTFHFLEEA